MNSEDRFYVTIGQIQEVLNDYYKKNGMFMSTADALTYLRTHKKYSLELENYKVLPAFYHLEPDELTEQIQSIQIEADSDKINYMKTDISFFQSERIDVFIQCSFHHELNVSHAHANFEVAYIYQGEYDFSFQGEHRNLTEGDVVIISPGAVHSFEEKMDNAFMISFYVNYNTLATSFLSILQNHDFLSDFFKEILMNQTYPNYLFLATGRKRNIKELVRNLFLEQHKYDEYSPQCSLCWLKIFFSYVMRQYTSVHQHSDYGNRTDLGPILEYINKNYKTSTLGEMAKHFNYSTSYLSTLIHKVTGKTYSQMIRQNRLSEAKDYLECTNKSVAEIAALCGYNDVDHFSKTFRTTYELSPQQYRRTLNISEGI